MPDETETPTPPKPQAPTPPKPEVTFEMLKSILANTIKRQAILEGRIRFIEEKLGFKFEGLEDAKNKKSQIIRPTLVT